MWRGRCELQSCGQRWRRCADWRGRRLASSGAMLGRGRAGRARRRAARLDAAACGHVGLLAGMRRHDQTRWRTRSAARIERGAWAALRCGDASAARGRAADTPGEKRAPHHSEQQRSCPLFGCDSLIERAVARRRAGALTRGRGGEAKGRRGAAAAGRRAACDAQAGSAPPSRSLGARYTQSAQGGLKIIRASMRFVSHKSRRVRDSQNFGRLGFRFSKKS